MFYPGCAPAWRAVFLAELRRRRRRLIGLTCAALSVVASLAPAAALAAGVLSP